MQPKFLYFDLGKVLINFSVEQMLRQIGAAAGIDGEAVRDAVFAGRPVARARDRPAQQPRILRGILRGHRHAGRLRSADCGGRRDFRAESPGRADRRSIAARPAIGWASCRTRAKRTGTIACAITGSCPRPSASCAELQARSNEAGRSDLPAAAELAGCRPEEIFFVDDIAGHVAGAMQLGSMRCSSPPPSAIAGTATARNSVQLLRRRRISHTPCEGSSVRNALPLRVTKQTGAPSEEPTEEGILREANQEIQEAFWQPQCYDPREQYTVVLRKLPHWSRRERSVS